MLTTDASGPSAVADPPEPTPLSVDDVHRPPERQVEPLTGQGPLPQVKRFNRKTVGILTALIGVVALAAFGTSFTRKPAGRTQDPSAAEATAPAPSAADAINNLPGSYRDAPHLGPPLPGEVGAILAGTPVSPGTTVSAGVVPPPSVPMTSSRSETESDKVAVRVRESGFGFSGGAGGGSTETGNPLDRLAGLAGIPNLPIGGAPVRPDRDADNRQDDKQEFLERSRGGKWALKDGVHPPTSPYTLFAGTVIPGVLLTGIDSDLPGQIEGQISQNVYDSVRGEHLILPQGTKLLGTYDSRITYGQSRVLVVWTRIIRPDGSNLDLEGMPGVDLSGYSGMTGNVDRHLGRILTAVVLGSVIQAGAAAGTSYSDPTFAGLARQGAGQGLNEATQQIVRKELQLQPTIRVAPGARFAVFTTKDVSIPPPEHE